MDGVVHEHPESSFCVLVTLPVISAAHTAWNLVSKLTPSSQASATPQGAAGAEVPQAAPFTVLAPAVSMVPAGVWG